MPVLRFSACRPGAFGNQTANFQIFGEDRPGRLEDDALAGVALDQVFRQNGDVPFFGQPVFRSDSALAGHIAALPDAALGDPDEPVVVFVHGFQFEVRRPRPDPFDRRESDNPHVRLFHFDEAAGSAAAEHELHLTPWLARAFFDGGTGAEADCGGLGVCFGYASYGDTSDDATPGLLDTLGSIFDFVTPSGRPENFYALAYWDAMIAGHALAAVLVHLAARLDAAGQGARPIHIVCHSLGTRTALKAVEVLAMRYPAEDRVIERIGKVVLLAGACLWFQAGKAIERIDQADPERRPEFFNILSTEDGVVRVLGARASLDVARNEAGVVADDLARLATFFRGAEVIGHEGKPPADLCGGVDYADWADVNLDSPAVQEWGRGEGLALNGDLGRLKPDHWIHFTHAQNWELYRRILRGEPGYSARDLAATVPR